MKLTARMILRVFAVAGIVILVMTLGSGLVMTVSMLLLDPAQP